MEIKGDELVVAIYIRVSTEKQKINTSYNMQRKSINTYINEDPKLKLAKQKFYKDAKSASKVYKNIDDLSELAITREGLSNLLRDANNKEFQYLICYSHDRLTRDVTQSFLLKHTLNKLGIKILYSKLGENVDNRNKGLENLFENLLNNLSALEANVISKRVKSAGIYKVNKGLWPGGRVPSGYKLKKLSRGRNNKVLVKGHESYSIERIFKLYNKGYRIKDIIDELDYDLSSEDKGAWSQRKIRSVLRNPIYKGTILWNKNGGVRNPGKRATGDIIKGLYNEEIRLIDDETWSRTKELRILLTENSKFLDTSFLLKGIVRCSMCGAILSNKNHGGDQRYYFCNSNNIKRKDEHIRYKADELEMLVIKKIQEISDGLKNNEKYKNEIYVRYDMKSKSENLQINKRIEDLNEIYEENKKIVNAYKNKIKCFKEERENNIQYSELIEACEEMKIKYEIINKLIEEEKKSSALLIKNILTAGEFKEKLKCKLNEFTEVCNIEDKKTYDRLKKRELRIFLYRTILNISVSVKEIEINFK